MSDEITRYDMSIEWGSMCGCEVVYVSDGEYVRYADYAALRAQLTTAERERDEARRALRVIADANVSYEAGTADYLDMAHQTVATVRRLRHRAEARREREEWETMVGTQRLVLEGMHRRAERAEREREAMQIDHADALDAYRQMYESERHRAERMAIDHTDAIDAYRQMYEAERDRAERMGRVVEQLRGLRAPSLCCDGENNDEVDQFRDGYTSALDDMRDILSAAVAAETCARSAPITAGDTQGEKDA